MPCDLSWRSPRLRRGSTANAPRAPGRRSWPWPGAPRLKRLVNRASRANAKRCPMARPSFKHVHEDFLWTRAASRRFRRIQWYRICRSGATVCWIWRGKRCRRGVWSRLLASGPIGGRIKPQMNADDEHRVFRAMRGAGPSLHCPPKPEGSLCGAKWAWTWVAYLRYTTFPSVPRPRKGGSQNVH